MGFLTGTDATYVDTMYCYGWQKDLTNGWEFKHGVVNTAPIDGLTIVGNDLKIGGSLDKTLIRLTASTPTAEQLAEIESAELPMFQENAKCLLQGASSSVQALSHDPVTDTLTVCSATNMTKFNGLVVVEDEAKVYTSYSSVNNITAGGS